MNGIQKWPRRITTGLLILVLALTALTWTAGTFAQSRIARENPPPGKLVEVGGFKMHMNCTGEGSPTVILEAGLDDFSIFWSQVQPEIAKVTRVCSYDRAGLGWSQTSPDPRTSATMVQELHSLLTNSMVDAPYVLVGHSFGGALMRLFAHTYPNEVAGIVLVDAAPDELFLRIPRWRNAIEGKLSFYRGLALLNSLGLLALAPENINRGIPTDMLTPYRAIATSTGYFQASLAENEAFENNLAEVRNANIDLGELPLIVISRGYWDPMPGFTNSENQEAWRKWQEMQSELLSLSSNSRQILATESEHSIHLQQPELVVDAINTVVEATQYLVLKSSKRSLP